MLLVEAGVGSQVLTAVSRKLLGVLLVAGGAERAASVRSELGAWGTVLLGWGSLVTAILLAAVVLLGAKS